MTEISLILPLPPSINVYWGFSGHKRFLTLQAREFKVQVAHIVSQQPIRFGNKRLDVNIVFHFKDKRRTDLDNYCKSLFDALTQANLMDDDSQIDSFSVIRGENIKGGKCSIKINVLHF